MLMTKYGKFKLETTQLTVAFHVQYFSVGGAISHIKNYGVGVYCCKTDIQSAFRIINLNYSQFKYDYLRSKNKFYVDTCF